MGWAQRLKRVFSIHVERCGSLRGRAAESPPGPKRRAQPRAQAQKTHHSSRLGLMLLWLGTHRQVRAAAA
jgi:hypothetical protein